MASRPWLEDTTTSAKRPWLDESSDIEAPYKGFDEIGTPVKAKQEPTKPTQLTTPPKKDPQAWRYQDIKIPSVREYTEGAAPQNQNSRDMKLTVPPTPDKERKHPAFNDTNEPWVQASLDRAPEGTRIQNTESPYWHLPEGQQKLVDKIVNSPGSADIETKREIIKKQFGFDYYAQPPYNLHGTTAGMMGALVENMFSRVGTLPPAENANEYAVMGAGLAGSLVPGAMAAGVTAPLGPVAQGVIGGAGANLAATPGNANREEIVKQVLLGALAGGFGGYGLSKGAPKPLSTANVDATPMQVSLPRMQPEVSPKMQVQMNRVSEIAPTVPKTEPVVSKSQQVPTSTDVPSQPVASVQGGGKVDFPESKVTETVYHGSPADNITEFFTEQGKTGGNTGATNTALGAYFSESPEIATTAAFGFSPLGAFSGKPLTLYDVKLNLRKPLDLDALTTAQITELEKSFPGFKSAYKKASSEGEKMSLLRFFAKARDAGPVRENFATFGRRAGLTDDVIEQQFKNRSGKEFSEWDALQKQAMDASINSVGKARLKALGYDGIVLKTISDSGDKLGPKKQYVVFDKENIAIVNKRAIADMVDESPTPPSPVGEPPVASVQGGGATYKTPKEFVESHPVVYHGTPIRGIKQLDPRKAIETEGAVFFTDNPDVAEIFRYPREYGEVLWDSKPGPVIKTRVALKNPMVLEGAEAQRFTDDTAFQGQKVREAKANGHDGIIAKDIKEGVGMDTERGTTYAVFNKEAIVSDQQLREQFKTTKSTPPSPVGKAKEPAIPDTPVQAIDDAVIPPTDPPRPKSPTLVPVDDTPDAIGLKKAEIERIRDGLELDRLPKAQRVTMEETLSRANEENTAARADAVAQRVLAGGEMSDTEYAGMTIRAAQLANESDDILSDIIKFQDEGNTVAEQQARLRLEEVTKQMDVLTRASDMAGTEQGRSLNLRKMMVNLEDYSLAKVTNRARERKGSALTEKETARIERVVNERNELQKQLDEALKRNEELTVKQEEIIAQRVAQAEATRANIRKKAASSREAIKADRDNIKKQLEAIGYRVNDITGVTTEGAYLIGKLAVSYIREGVTNLAEVVKLVKNDLPDLSDYDIYRAMNTRDPNVQARMASEATKKVESLKRQARILADIEDAEKGIFRPTNKRAPSDAEVSHLKRQLTKLRNAAYSSGIHPDRLEKAIRTINELQDRIEKHYTPLTRRLKPEITSELAAMKEQIADLKKHLRLEDELADLNEQIRTGEFKVPQKKMRRPESPEIARLRMARDRARNKIEAELEILAPMTGKRVLGETVNTLRTLKATADLSATLRQGLVLSVTRPSTAFKAFGQGVKSMFSKHTAEQIDYAIKNRETAYLGDRAGLYLAELADARLTSHEEAFMSRFVEKVPVMGAIVRGSERAMVTQLNILRSAAFDEFIRVNPNATATELKAWANFVNVASGRGDLGRLAGAADYLSTVFFAPRFAASRFQTPYMFLKYAKEPRVRKAIAKDLVGTIGLGATMLTLAGMAGADVSGDPRDPDFGKIKIGPTRIDVWAGFQQPARLIANPALGWAFAKKANKRRDDSFIEQAMRFASFKLAPTITLPSELMSGRTVIGEKIDRVDALANSVIPMMYEDVFDAYRQQGLGMAALTTGLNLVGVSTNTYQKKK